MESVTVKTSTQDINSDTAIDRARAIANSFREPPSTETSSRRIRSQSSPLSPKPSSSPPIPRSPISPSPPNSPPSRSISRSPPSRLRPRFRSSSRRPCSRRESDSEDDRPLTPLAKRTSPPSHFHREQDRRVARRLHHSSTPYNNSDRPSSASLPETFIENDSPGGARDDLQKPSTDYHRSRDEDDYHPYSRRPPTASRRSTDMEDTKFVIIPSESVGFIIGKQGQTIRAITKESGAEMTMDEKFPGPDRRFAVIGTPEAVSICLEIIDRKLRGLRDRSMDGWDRSVNARRGPSRYGPSRRMDHPVEMWIDQSKIGMVIGTKGSNIQAICLRSGTSARVDNARVNGDKKLLIISGPKPNTYHAQELVNELLEGGTLPNSRPPSYCEDRPRRDHVDWSTPPRYEEGNHPTKIIYIPRASVGHVIGKNGTMIRELRKRSRADIVVCPDEDSGDSPERMVTIQGPEEVIEAAHSMIRDIISRGVPKDAEVCSSGRDREIVQENRAFASQRWRHDSIERKFELSGKNMGLLIGKNGVTIEYIQERSGAKVHVSGKLESERESPMRTVSIVGTKPQVMIAQILIADRLGLDDSELDLLGINSKCADKMDVTMEKKDNNGKDISKAEETTGNDFAQQSIAKPSESKPSETSSGNVSKGSGTDKEKKDECQVPNQTAAPPHSGPPYGPPHGFHGYPYPPPGHYPPGPYPHPPQMYGEAGMMPYPPFGQHAHSGPMPFGNPPSTGGKDKTEHGDKKDSKNDNEVGKDNENKKETKNGGTGSKDGVAGSMTGHGFYGYPGPGMMYPPHMYGGFGYPHGPPGAGPPSHFMYGRQTPNGKANKQAEGSEGDEEDKKDKNEEMKDS